MLDWISQLKEFILLDASKRNLILSYLLFGLVIWYQHSESTKIKDKLDKKDDDTQELIKKTQIDCSEQLKTNQETYQRQLSAFIVQKNNEQDSVYDYFNSKIRRLNERYEKNNKLMEVITK